MILRRRQRSSRPGDVTYFWRHQDNTSLDCEARFSVNDVMSSERRRQKRETIQGCCGFEAGRS
jgi:hypothetical protein